MYYAYFRPARYQLQRRGSRRPCHCMRACVGVAEMAERWPAYARRREIVGDAFGIAH